MVLAGKLGDQNVQDEHREHRNDPVGKGDGRIGHRDAGKFRHDERDDKFEGLQLRKLPLAHQTHDEQQKHVSDYGPQKHGKHILSLYARAAFIRLYFQKNRDSKQ